MPPSLLRSSWALLRRKGLSGWPGFRQCAYGLAASLAMRCDELRARSCTPPCLSPKSQKKSALHRYCVCNSAVGASACCLQELGSCPLVALIDGCEPPVSRVTVLGGVRDSASGVRSLLSSPNGMQGSSQQAAGRGNALILPHLNASPFYSACKSSIMDIP